MSSEALPAASARRAKPRLSATTLEIWDRRFYLTMAIASAVLVFLGFMRTFYLRVPFGRPPVSPLIAVHGIVFSGWMIFFILQAALIAARRRDLHRWLGYAGVILATAMVFLGVFVALNAERLGHSHGTQDPETVFLVALGDIFTFAIFVSAGFVWRRNRQAHQRLMFLAAVAGLIAAAIPRLPVVGVIGGASPGMVIVGFSFLLAGPIYDFISRRRIRPVYIWGCLFAFATLPPIRIAIASTPAWHHLARRLAGL